MTDEILDAAIDARDGTIELVSAYVANANTGSAQKNCRA